MKMVTHGGRDAGRTRKSGNQSLGTDPVQTLMSGNLDCELSHANQDVG